MDAEQTTVPPEELAAEQAAIAPPKEEEIRADIISEFGFDEEEDKEKIDKAVKRELKSREALSKAIGQKRTWREKANKKPEVPSKKDSDGPDADKLKDKDLSTDDVLALVGAHITHPDDIKEIKKSAKLLEKPISEVLSDDLVQARLKNMQEKRRTADAANMDAKRSGNTRATDSEVLEKARRGELPEPGSPEAEQLFYARRGGKRS